MCKFRHQSSVTEPRVTSPCDREVVASVHGGEEQLWVLTGSAEGIYVHKKAELDLLSSKPMLTFSRWDKVHLEDIQSNKYRARGFLRVLQVIKTPGRFYLSKASLADCCVHTDLFLDIVLSLPAANEACSHPRAHLPGPSACCVLHGPGSAGLNLPRHRRLNKRQKENELEENQQAAKEKLNYISCTHMHSFGCRGRKCSQNWAVFILNSVSIHWLILHFVPYEPGLGPWMLLRKEEYSQKGTLKKLAAVSRQCVWPAGRRWLLQGSVWSCKIICEPALLSL